MEAPQKEARPPKRPPQQQRALDRIDAILAATQAVVAEGGYDALTMVNIAARAGVTHTSIYHYFTSVEAILATLITRQLQDFGQGVEEILSSVDTPQDLIEAVLQSVALGFDIYRREPVVRGLWAATRYLPALRKLDDEDNVRHATLFSRRFMELAPGGDANAIYRVLLMIGSLSVPAYATALAMPRRMQKPAVEDYLAMVRGRLVDVVLGAAG
jgi:AcrR family transcriptional regulator